MAAEPVPEKQAPDRAPLASSVRAGVDQTSSRPASQQVDGMLSLVRNQFNHAVAWAVLLVWSAMLAAPQDTSGENELPTASAAPTRSSEIKTWLEALSAREFSKRQQATRKLLAAGPQAIFALQSAATSSQSESRARAVSILEELSLSIDPETWKPAQAALRELASSSTSSARRAASVLAELGDKQTRRMTRAIRRQGGRVYKLQNGRLRVDLNEEWVGGNRGVQALPRLPGV
ncbi:MAG: hypothetical protein CMJ70_11555, partial [Planctomycetaceae bacterium]|nr:hypothetical protein [Planctomycetaceae bacterium]